MPRLFYALRPDAPARDALASLARRMADEGRGRPVPAANLHLTLAFLGDVDDGRVDALLDVGASVRAGSFDLVLDRRGSFHRAGVGWAGPSSPVAALTGLQSGLDAALRRAGFDLEDRPFVPHLTLVRKLATAIADGPIEPVRWRTGRFALVVSARDKAAYADMAGWDLGTGS